MEETTLIWCGTLAQSNVGMVVRLLEVILQLGPYAISQHRQGLGEDVILLTTGVMLKRIDSGAYQGAWISILDTQGKVTLYSEREFGSSEPVKQFKQPFIEFNGTHVKITHRDHGELTTWVIAPEGGLAQLPASAVQDVLAQFSI